MMGQGPLRAQALVPQVQFRHGNVILKHSRLKVDEKKREKSAPKPKPEKISERTKEELNLM